MAIDFPTSPTAGQVYTFNGVTYVYSAQGVWVTAGASAVANVSQVGFRAHKNGVAQTGIASNIPTKLSCGFEDFDYGGYYDTATSRWTPPAGLVHIYGSVFFSAGLTNANPSDAQILKNGVLLKRSINMNTTSGSEGTQVHIDDFASGTDYYEFAVRGISGATSTVDGSVDLTYFGGHVTGGPVGPVGPSGSVTGAPTAPQGRLTLQTATPVMTTTQAAKTTIYYTPYLGNRVPIYDGTNMVMTTFAELIVATTDTAKSPAAIGASKVNDWFVWSDAGTVRIGHGPDWTSDTARSAGTALTMVNGIWLNNAAITNGPAAQRGTYVGTTRSNASSQLDWTYAATSSGGTAGVFGVWNAYNRVRIGSQVGEGVSSYTYATASFRQVNASAGNQIGLVVGLSLNAVEGRAVHFCSVSSGSPITQVGIGVNSTTTNSARMSIPGAPISAAAYGLMFCEYADYPGLGYYTFAWLELGAANISFYGSAATNQARSGMTIEWEA